ncbi:formyltransferase family protein [Blattabacterium cuenoti]|uniref:formyltransferase family protein n=1 Tax=Blattabacterium cuenoti TaxID=1653831 RepID=UPI00163CB607|nr:formyltransferase family protein [Blattabacterium cuenoti]
MKKLAILVSGNGTNMKHILHAIYHGELKNCKVDLVVSDRACKAIQYSLKKNIPTFHFEKINQQFISSKIHHILIKYIPDIIVLSGFLSILNADFCKKWDKKIINIHPSLLPKYGGKGMYGMKIHQKVLKNKEKISGATVHYVNKHIDSGKIILQKSCLLSDKETIKSLYKKISIIEKKILIQSLNNF